MGFGYSPEELKIMDNSSYTVLPKEYKQGDYTSLATTMNSVVAGIHRNRVEDNTKYDTSAYNEIPFNEDTLKNVIANEKDPYLQAELASSHIRDWNQYEGRKNYLSDLREMNTQVHENFSTAGMIAAGLPMALLDVDSLLINPTLAGVNKVNKALNLQSRMSKVVSHTIAGGLVGAESMAVYEATTGVYNDDSVTNSALMGMALGGSLGMFTTRAGNIKPDYVNATTGEKVDVAVLKEQELAKAQKELTRTDEAIRIQTAIEDSIKANEAKLKEASTEDVKRTKGTLSTVKDTLLETLNKAKEDVRVTIDEYKLFKNSKDTMIKDTTKVSNEIQTLLKTKEESIAKAQEIQVLRSQLKEAVDSNKASKAIANKLDKLEKSYVAWNKAGDRKIRDLTKIVRDNNIILKNSQEGQKELESKLNTHKENVKIQEEAYKQYDARYTNDKKIVSDYSKKLGISIEKANEMLKKDRMKSLLGSKGLLTSKMADIQGDKLDLLGVKKVVHNYVDKLTQELSDMNKEIENMQKLEGSSLAKKLPSWAAKLLISPIEKLLYSDNALVSGLASMLHAGTIHHGKIVTRTAYRIRQELDETLRRHTLAVEHNYRLAKEDGYKGSKDEFEVEVSQQMYKTIGQMQRDMFSGISGEKTWQERLEIANKANVNRQYFTDNKHISNSVDEMLNYYEGIHARGSKLGLENFTGSIGRGYVKRFYDRDKILALGRDNSIKLIYDAQVAHAYSNNKVMNEDVLKEFKEQATTAVDSSINKLDKMHAITKELGKTQQSVTSPFKQRSIEAYDDDLMKLLEDDIFTNSSIYGLNVHGRLALKEKLGVDNTEQLEKLFKDTNASNKEVDNLRVVANTILGHREVTKNPFAPSQRIIKAVSSYSSLMHTAAFGVATVTEIASIAKEFGWKSTINHLIPSIKKVNDIYLKGSPSDKNQIELFTEFGSAYFSSRANRMDIDSPFEATTRIQEKVDGMVHKLSVLGGLLPITDMLKMTTITAGVDFLAKMSVKGKISDVDMMRINDMGFDANDLVRIRDTLKVSTDGRINNMDRKSWGVLDQELTDGLANMIERTILHPNGITLPKFMTDVDEGAWISKVMMKFMRFPVESYERLLVRGLQEADAKQALAVAGNVAMWSAILMAKDALKEDDRKKYNKDDWEEQLFKDSMLNNSFTSGPTSLIDKVYGTFTGENLTNEYKYKMFGPIGSDLTKLQQLRPTFSLPFYNMNIGDGVANIFNTLDILDTVGEDLKDK